MPFGSPHSTRARDAHLAHNMIRLRDPDTGDFLHLSGQGSTKDIGQSWLGYRHQADTLRSRACLAGTPFPYKAIHRDLADDRDQVRAA
ncbi:hypothetical protein Q8W25_17800 [Shimia thalassica]|uniref:hypothetical protein n=1 Tax=Shimia thalassica TaxID=1715693 RepID=UPI00273599C4|nr:hypothetical protein [Shimia thalassica]MDP2495887.1 hypothetical protein [Shimia thalassica]